MYLDSCFMILAVVAVVLGDTCPSGGEIYATGITEIGKEQVVNAHNKYRNQIMNGEVPSQPRGRNLLMMKYDDHLGELAQIVSKTCQMKHMHLSDDRWYWVGQNTCMHWSSSNDTDQNWNEVVDLWFDEYRNFIYPNEDNGGSTLHYTQVVWATSKFIGCGFIAFYDNSSPSYPFCKIYTCNYGPGGNWVNQAPYELA